MKMRIPKIRNIETAIEIYYSNIELDNQNIRNLFVTAKGGELSSSRVCELKNVAREEMRKEGVPVYNDCRVNTKVAYKAWGIDVLDLENRYMKLQELKFDPAKC